MFDLSHSHKTNFKMGQLIPTLCMECLPGDKFSMSPESLTRFMPLVSPAMTKFNITHHFFFVPNRLLWDGWEDFITGKEVLDVPYIDTLSSVVIGDLGNYMGIPIIDDDAVKASAMPFAAYALIYDEYYRDQRLFTESFTPLSDGDNTSIYGAYAAGIPFIRCWGHDYFTSCMPYPQEGAAPVVIPITHSGNDLLIDHFTGLGLNAKFKYSSTDLAPSNSTTLNQNSGNINNTSASGYIDPNGTLYADISSDAGTIADLRRAIVLQEFLERDLRGGLRYVENIYSHFGVRSKDSRLQRPEYIGGSKSNVVISEVLSAAETTEYNSNDVLSPIGSFAGHAIGVTGGNRFKYYCEEHGWILCITSVMPEADYFQGLHRQWWREDRLDFMWHEFSQIGEQEVKVKELFCEDTAANLELTFGYIPRYSEYKYLNNRISGDMQNTLDYWHLARKFSAKPTLNDTFLLCVPDTRIFADEAGSQLIAHIHFNIDAFRQLPKFSNPKL